MQIKMTSIMVDDQEKALKFYTEVLGFIKKKDIPVGEHRWLTVVSSAGPDDVELAIEPMGIEAARTFQKALYDADIPLTAFAVPCIDDECVRLRSRGVKITTEPTRLEGWPVYAVFDDTCGNLIQIYQE
jgi:predicted enzyme related to lactoylglutathione lyase